MKTRILQFSTESGEKEYVVFTEDLKGDIGMWCRPGFNRDSDNIIDFTMPAGFPLDIALTRTLGPE